MTVRSLPHWLQEDRSSARGWYSTRLHICQGSLLYSLIASLRVGRLDAKPTPQAVSIVGCKVVIPLVGRLDAKLLFMLFVDNLMQL